MSKISVFLSIAITILALIGGILYISIIKKPTAEKAPPEEAFIYTPSNLPAAAKECAVSGCSGQLCVEEGQEVGTICEWLEKYACYDTAKCERQADGKCGWTQDEQLLQCLSSTREIVF